MNRPIVQDQIRRLGDLAFAESLNQTSVEYLQSFSFSGPLFYQRYADRFTLPVLVDPRVDLGTLIDRAGVKNALKAEKLSLTAGNLAVPYVFFTHDPRFEPCASAATVFSHLSGDEEGVNLQELLFFCLFYPEVFASGGWDAILTGYHTIYHPCLVKTADQLELCARWHYDETHGFRPVSKGRLVYRSSPSSHQNCSW